ncbi:DUF742 domain-containing protein [Streptomyces sp. H27-D2]|uniref:DUF742 domain-containing protein n=1 Tax=Streptomyces sp. H27-D2 TaxID=3046304 RepID=UPI002DBD6C85|nr:DUF742 domain-containing protein [Streptomyces sp. H27-D2]MEC4020410.1 DUF742 domain-containing protein [Streptomyces sp. H27-D2]
MAGHAHESRPSDDARPRDSGPYEARWYDAEAGPLVRPYAMTGGRTRPRPGDAHFDLVASVAVRQSELGGGEESKLGPEHRSLLSLCGTGRRSVAELASGTDLPLGVVRVLLGDLLGLGYVRVARPVPPAELAHDQILREVIDGLREL